MNQRLAFCTGVLVAAVSTAACSGGGAPSVPAGAINAASAAPEAGKPAQVTIRVHIPAKASDAAFRRRNYVSPSTQSMSIATGSGTPTVVNLTPSSPGCTTDSTGTTCSASAAAPVGPVTFTVTTYDGLGATGNKLSDAVAMATILMGAANEVDLVLAGVVASITIVLPTPGIAACTASSEAVVVNALDADKNIIVGSTNYDRTIALTLSDPTGDATMPATTIAKPGDGATITYNGKYEPGATITATATGVAPVTATFFPVPTVCKEYALTTAVRPAGLNYIRAGSDGNMYWTEEFTGQLGHIIPSGTLMGTEAETVLAPPTAVGTAVPMTAAPDDLTTGPDKALWIGDAHNGIDTFNPTSMLQANYGSGTYDLDAIANGPGTDGRLWFTDSAHHLIDTITTAGVIGTPINDDDLQGSRNGLVAGPDGAMWVTEPDFNAVLRITTDGKRSNEFMIGDGAPGDTYAPNRIVVGADKNLWMTESGNSNIVRITPNGTNTPTIKLFALPQSTSISFDITAGADGNVWFTEATNAGDRIARITPSGTITEYPVLTAGSTGVFGIAAGPDNNIWFLESANGDGRVCYLTI